MDFKYASRDIFLQLELHLCEKLNQPYQFLHALEQVIAAGNFIPLEKNRVRLAENRLSLPPVTDLGAYFLEELSTREDWDRIAYSPFRPQQGFFISLRDTVKEEWRRLEPVFGAIEFLFSVQRYGSDYNFLNVSCTLFGRASGLVERQGEHSHFQRAADLLRDIGRTLIADVHPQYSLITDSRYNETYGQDILDARLKYIHWCNYFGPSYLGKYGAKTFLKSPGAQVEPFSEGIWVQISDKIEGFHQEKTRQLVRAHYLPLGVEPASLVDYSPGRGDKGR
jgi:hypothetical protein